MTQSHLARALALSTALALCLAAAQPAAAAVEAPSFQEVMHDGLAFGELRFSPDGNRLLYAREDRRQRSHGLILQPVEGLYVADLATGARQRIGEGRDAYLEACATWSPDGRGVVLLRRRGGEGILAYQDLASGRTVEFAPPVATFCNSWVGDRLVFTTPGVGAPSGWSNAAALDNLGRRWRAAWETDAPQVTVHSSNPDFPSPTPAGGGIAVGDPRTGAAVMVAQGDFNVVVTPSPDGRRFAAIRQAEPLVGSLDRMTGRRGEAQVYEMTPTGARLVQAAPGFDAGKASLAWSADGRRLLVGGRAPGAAAASLLVLDLEQGSIRSLPAPPRASLVSSDTISSLSLWPLGWVGDRPAVLAETEAVAPPPADQRMDYGKARGRAMHLFAYGPSGAAEDLTAFARQSVDRFAPGPAGDAILVADGVLWSAAPGRAPRRISPAGLEVLGLAEARSSYGGPLVTPIGAGRVAVRAQGADGDRFVVLELAGGREALAQPATGEVAFSPDLRTLAHVDHQGWSSTLQVAGGRTRTVEAVNADWRDRPAGRVERYSYRLGARELNGWIVLPPGYRGGALPAIVWIYGGQVLRATPPEAALPGGGVTALYSGQLWAGEGYAVIYTSTPIGPGADTDIPGALAAAAIAAVDAAAAHGWVDPDRVGIMGQSFGGYSTASVLAARSDRFRAGVAVSGVYDFAAGWGGRMLGQSFVDEDSHPFVVETLGYVEGGQGGLLAPPWAAAEAYRRNSPFYRVADIKSPLLLLQGDLDLGVTSLSLAERFYAALRRTGNKAALVRYWGEDHVQHDPWAVTDEWRRATAWFDLYVRRASGTPPKP
jgi:dipeptidyl aminopeptidase/acylaminoacyl peptidase